MKPGYVIAVVGATGFVGRELATALHSSSQIPIRLLKLFASSRHLEDDIYLEHDRFHVEPLPADPLVKAQFDNVDIVFLATPKDVTRKLASLFLEEGMIVVDVGGWAYEGAPKSVMGIDIHEEFFSDERYISIPSSPAYIISNLLWRLRSFGMEGARAHISVGASFRGRKGVEELSGQVSSVFNYRDAPRKVFSQGLAFDLAPSVREIEDDERRILEQIAHILDMEETAFDVSLLYTSMFSGLGIQLQILLSAVNIQEIQETLNDGIFGWSPTPHGPKALMGGSGIQFGKIRLDGLGQGIHLWLSADGIRAGIVDNCCGVLAALIERGLL